jgi:hypothetical protein
VSVKELLRVPSKVDWLKLAILGTVLETSRRFLTSWYIQAKDALFLTVTFDSDDISFRASVPICYRSRRLMGLRVDYELDGQAAGV